MNIQSLSLVTPSLRCINNCRFCCSKMGCSQYTDTISGSSIDYEYYEAEYIKRLAFARDNGCNTAMITGDCEPQQNKPFLQRFGSMNRNLIKPFRCIEMQTTGVLLNEDYLKFLRNHVGVSTISVSISSFDAAANNRIIQPAKSAQIDLPKLLSSIKTLGINLRLSVNLTDEFNSAAEDPHSFFQTCKGFGADQVTLRILYAQGENAEADYVRMHGCNAETVYSLNQYVTHHGRALEKLEFGRTKFSVNGMSIVIDDDCMSTEASNTYKYLILRPNCKLYSKWDDAGSLIF